MTSRMDGDQFSASQFGASSPRKGASLAQSSAVLGMTAGPSMKGQLDSIAMTVHEVVGRVELAGRQIIQLEEDRDRIKTVIQSQDEVLNNKIISECAAVRDDTTHKFALQVAENKRLQAQLAKSQADIARLTRLCENMAVRLQILEAHTGVSS